MSELNLNVLGFFKIVGIYTYIQKCSSSIHIVLRAQSGMQSRFCRLKTFDFTGSEIIDVK